MTFHELQAFIDEQDALFRRVKDMGYNERERVFARTVKLGEEYGELCDAVLGALGDQRRDKLPGDAQKNLEGEFADVIIVTFLLAKSMGVAIGPALSVKIEEIRKKHNIQI